MRERLDVKIDVELGPIEVVWLRTLDMKDRAHGRVSEPREVPECQEVLGFVQQHPKAVRGNAEDFNA